MAAPSSPSLLPRVGDGSLDRSFGNGGTVRTAFAGDGSVARDVAVQPDGRIVVAGYRGESGGFSGAFHGFALVRYRGDGSLDPTFGSGGRVTTPIGSGGLATALALQPDGRIVAVGSTLGAWTDVSPFGKQDFALARYRPDGGLDGSFGSGGTVTTELGGEAPAEGVALRPDGRIVVAGTTGLDDAFVLAAYEAEGSLDRNVGKGGIVTTEFRGGYARAHAVGIQRDGKVVVAGEGLDSSKSRLGFALARYLETQAICRVPRVVRKPLRTARRAITRSHCSVGRVRRGFSERVRAGRVISQRPKAGVHLVAGAKVNLVVSKGTRTLR